MGSPRGSVRSKKEREESYVHAVKMNMGCATTFLKIRTDSGAFPTSQQKGSYLMERFSSVCDV